MSSQINNTNIDSTYPVAGKDNDSQGFRDNFSAIKNNFAYAKSELEDLQSKVILKAALTNDSLNNDMGGANISNGTYTNFHGTTHNQTVSGAVNVNVSSGSLQKFTLTGNTTFTFTNWPEADGVYANVRVQFKSSGSIISVGNDITLGKRYTIEEVNTTDFVAMGADPTAVFKGSIDGATLTVTSCTGKLTVDTYLIGSGIAAGTKIIATQAENPLLNGTGGLGTYTVNIVQSVAPDPAKTYNGITTGIIFNAITKGSGTGKVKPWREVTLSTENSGSIVPSSNFDLPILLDPSTSSEQAIEVWTESGASGGNKVYVNYIGNLGGANTNYTNLNVGTLSVDDPANSTSSGSGALTVTGGAGVAKNLNVGGDVVIDGNLLVSGNTTLITSSVTISDINDITNVEVDSPRNGDTLKYKSSTGKWTNNVDLIEYQVSVGPNNNVPGGDPVFYINDVPISTSAGVQISDLKTFRVGKKYRFIQEDTTNQDYPLRFSTTPDTVVYADNNPGDRTIIPFSVNVTVNGTPGQSGAYTEILVTEDTPSPLYLYAQFLSTDLEIDSSVGVFSNFEIVGTEGQFQVSSPLTLGTNKPIRISGAWQDTTPPYGYNSAGTIYYIKEGGTGTTFQLLQSPGGTPVNTTVGVPNTLVLTISALKNTTGYVPTSKVGAEHPINVANGPVKVVTNYTVPGTQNIIADTTAGAITITLPVAPSVGTTISIFDSGNAGTNAITVDPGDAGVAINGNTGNVTIAGNHGSMTLVSDGANWTMARLSFNGSEDVAPSTALNLSTSVSYFSTSGIESSTLADGVEGQVKTLIMKSASGEMSVSVSNAGWKSSGPGTITLNQTGDSCILQFIQGKWYVIGNNSCVIEGKIPGEVTSPPITAGSAGVTGQIAYDGSYIYICVADNTWRRATTASW